MYIKKFIDFIQESGRYLNMRKGVDSVDDNADEEIEKNINTYIKDKTEECPRCGESIKDCSCEDDDFRSTININRNLKEEDNE
jgi:hypothetical protein